MHRLNSVAPAPEHSRSENELQIGLLGEFSFSFRGQPIAAAAWQRSHARRLIQMLCSASKLSEARPRVLEALWPGFEDARARNRLHHTIHCIRKAWEEIPAQARPQIVVSSERVEFVPAPGTLIDVQAFILGVESDCAEAEARLVCLEQGLACYRGRLAPGWDDCAEIEARRVWLAQLLESSLREAIDIAKEINRPAVALRHAQHLALLLECDCDAHCQYALLLAENARPDAALLHCQNVRATIELEEPQALLQLDQTIQAIQQRANRGGGVPATGIAGSARSGSPGLVGRLGLAAPTRQVIGYEAWLQVCAKCIEDPFGSVISVVGPPGAGKSLLAATVAHRLQGTLQHGAVWLDACEWREPQALLDALASALAPLCGAVAATEAALLQQLQNKEMLIVVDGLQVSPAVVRLCSQLALGGRDTRWLLTAWSALQLRGERVIHLEPSQLTQQPADGSPSHAARIVQSLCAPAWQLDDPRSMRLIEQIASALDGLPQSLEMAAQCLDTDSPSELWARLQRDLSALLRGGLHDPDTSERPLAHSVSAWLGQAAPGAQRLLSLLSQCRSWLTREDIGCLLGDSEAASADALIDHCVRHQFLLRRSRVLVSMPWSEFRVPRIVTAGLRVGPDPVDPAWRSQRMQAWLASGHRAAQAEPGGHMAASRWFDDHFEDIDALASGWLESDRLTDLATFCCVHAPHWPVARHSQRMLGWLVGLGETMTGAPPSLAARLLVERARLRVHLGQLHLACDDASRALARVVAEPDTEVRRQAVQMIQRYGAAGRDASQRPGALSGRGVEAGESLLRVGQLAVRHGQLGQALAICGQSAEVFKYFGLSHGLLKAHHYRAKIAFALGDTDLASRCLADVQRVATHVDDGREAARAALMQADVLLSRMLFSQAADLASTLIAKAPYADDPALVARGLAVVAWAHYGRGAYPIAHALCVDLREQAARSGRIGLQVNAEMLSALIDARRQRPAAAIRSVCSAVELLTQAQPLSDAQSDLVNVAELAVHLDRCDLAAPLVRSLEAFSEQPNQRLRHWVRERVRSLNGVATAAQLGENDLGNVPNCAEVLKSLALV